MSSYNFFNGAQVNKFDMPNQTAFCHEYLDSLVDKVNKQNEEILKLTKQNTILENRTENEHVEKLQKEIKDLKRENENLNEQIWMGFTIEDRKCAEKWYISHQIQPTEKCKVGHQFTWMIYPTGLGLVKKVCCSCGAVLDMTKIDEFG